MTYHDISPTLIGSTKQVELLLNPRNIIPNLADLGRIVTKKRGTSTRKNGGGDMTSLISGFEWFWPIWIILITILGSSDKCTQLKVDSSDMFRLQKLRKQAKQAIKIRMSLYWPWSNSRFHFEFESKPYQITAFSSQLWDEDAPRPPTVAQPS